jgi:hypothetical protein
MNNDYSSPNHKDDSEDQMVQASPALEIPTQVPMPAPAPVQSPPVAPKQAFPRPEDNNPYRESALNHPYSHTIMSERQEELLGHEFDQMHVMGRFQTPQMQAPHSQWGEPNPQPGYGQPNGSRQTVQVNESVQEWQHVSDLADTASIPDDTMSIDSDENKGRSKAQMKNQKKHQRQRERKAKELRNQCMQLVVKWKLSTLAAPLIGMGFPEEQCMDAVCACSDGKAAVDLERCVAWLINEQAKGSAFSFGNNDDDKREQSRKPDIDITD